MAQENSVISKAGRRKGSGGGRKARVINGLNKGLWTPEEDAILIKYVEENGERSWNDIRRKHGLMRCGKSCRRRWMNNLRSSLKKENFTLEEENKILRLHAQYGNRWSLLALHFPGRTDNEIKNYWNVRHKRLTRTGLPIYPPEIQKEIDLRTIHLQQEEHIENQLQISPSSSSSQNQTNHDSSSILTPSPSFELAEKFNDKSKATSSSSSHQAHTTISFSSPSSLDENPVFSLINPMKYPLLYASLYHPSKMLLDDSNGKAIMAPPPPSIILPSYNSPYITPIDQTPITLFEKTPFPKMDDAFFSENFELEIPSIHSSFQKIAPMSDHIIVPPNGDNNQSMDPEFFLERNNGMLGDILRQSRALFSSKENHQFKDDQYEGRIVPDDDTIAIMHNTFNNVNMQTNFAPIGVDKTPLESTSSLQSTDMGVDSQARVFEDFNMMENDLPGWSELQQTAPESYWRGHVPAESLIKSPRKASNVVVYRTNEPSNVLNCTMAAATNNLHNPITPAEIDHDWGAEVTLSPIETIPADTDHDWAQDVMGSPIAITPLEQDHDWATGFFPSFI